jgi:hypothetical protein
MICFSDHQYSPESLAIEQLVKAGDPMLDMPFLLSRPIGPIPGS